MNVTVNGCLYFCATPEQTGDLSRVYSTYDNWDTLLRPSRILNWINGRWMDGIRYEAYVQVK